jgi:hypothetical protein
MRTTDWRLDSNDVAPPFDTGDDNEAGLIYFNVADTLSGASITSAMLYLYNVNTETDTGDTLVIVGLTAAGLDDYTASEWNATYQYYDVSGTNTWSPHISTYDTYISMGDHNVRAPTDFDASTWYSFDVTEIVQDWVTDGDPEGGFMIHLRGGSDTINIECPRDECGAATRPYLEVEVER